MAADSHRRHWLGAVAFTAVLVVLIAFAAADIFSYFFIEILLVTLASVAVFYRMFPSSQFFVIALVNFLAVYTCVFVFFLESNFRIRGAPLVPLDSLLPVTVAYVLPVAAFIGGAWRRRQTIRAIVAAEHMQEERHLGRVLLWLVPVFAVGALSFLIPIGDFGESALDGLLEGSMALIAVIVLFVSRDVAMFLVDASLMFEGFFRRIARLAAPALAFFTFYSLIVLVFASVYRIMDRYSATFHFLIDGTPHKISFPESLYFSITTLAAVGYGDITPLSNIARVLVSLQIVFGALLLLFGFSEIISYSREHERRK